MTILTEHRGVFSTRNTYRIEKNGVIKENETETAGQESRPVSTWRAWVQCTQLTLRQVFLPYGFPSSVSPDYTAYQIWDTLQAFASSITGALATEAVMRGVGVGNLEATPLAAAMTWLLKQGSGMIGRIVFAWSKGTALDYDNKKWRLFADVLNDLATFIDLITPWFPSDVVVFVFCGSSVARSLVGVAGGATRASITQHQARNHNSADVSAKDGSQETLVNLISLCVCLVLLPTVSGNFTVIWILFALFTWIHVFSNYRAVRALQFESFNTSRLLIALSQYLKDSKVPSIQDVNRLESVVIGFGVQDIDLCGYRIRMGVSFEAAKSSASLGSKEICALIETFESKSFIIIPNVERKEVNVILAENISASDMIEAYSRVILAAFSAERHNETHIDALSSKVDHDWEVFRNRVMSAGYDLPQSTLESADWRAKWRNV